ncbi:MAG TPA: outer membrane beta-barrel protein [Bacteroidales bacterium]|nr:outer membrane beta-barrel protein [Bacteroidales bacterium]
MFVGGAFSVEMDKTKNATEDIYKRTSFGITPKVGYYLNDQFAIGGAIGYTTSSYTYFYGAGDADDTKSTSNNMSISPFIRYHAVEAGNFSLFVEPMLSIGFGSSKSERGSTTTSDADHSSFGIQISPAMSYKINDKINIEAYFGGLSYSSSTEKEGDNKRTATSFGLEFSSRLALGFIYKF